MLPLKFVAGLSLIFEIVRDDVPFVASITSTLVFAMMIFLSRSSDVMLLVSSPNREVCGFMRVGGIGRSNAENYRQSPSEMPPFSHTVGSVDAELDLLPNMHSGRDLVLGCHSVFTWQGGTAI